jgi:hypothetical protein
LDFHQKGVWSRRDIEGHANSYKQLVWGHANNYKEINVQGIYLFYEQSMTK